MQIFLEADPKNVCVVHCTVRERLYTFTEIIALYHFGDCLWFPSCSCFITSFVFVKDGKANSALLICAFLIFVDLFERPEDAAQMFAVKRMPPSIRPSHMRYVVYCV